MWRRRQRGTSPVWLVLDRYLIVVSAGLVAGVYLLADIAQWPLSQGTQAAMGSFVAYALIKSRTDARWRAIELERAEMQALVEALDSAVPGSAEAIEVRRQLVALARRAGDSGEGNA